MNNLSSKFETLSTESNELKKGIEKKNIELQTITKFFGEREAEFQRFVTFSYVLLEYAWIANKLLDYRIAMKEHPTSIDCPPPISDPSIERQLILGSF